MSKFKYLEGLPTIPEYLIPEVYRIIKECKNMYVMEGSPFSEYSATGPLVDFLTPYFPVGWYITVQLITRNSRIHPDRGRHTVAIYLIETGGQSVATNFYSAPPEQKLIASYVAEPFRWFQLDAQVWHGVAGIEPTTPRISITAYQPVNLGKSNNESYYS